jgi:hypothetical protein
MTQSLNTPQVIITLWTHDEKHRIVIFKDTPEQAYETFDIILSALSKSGKHGFIGVSDKGDDRILIPVKCIISIDTRNAKKPGSE